jgi:hypothetical protein
VEKLGPTLIVCAERASASDHSFQATKHYLCLQIYTSPGSVVAVSTNRYFNSELSVNRLNRFINHVKPATENQIVFPVLGDTRHSQKFSGCTVSS